MIRLRHALTATAALMACSGALLMIDGCTIINGLVVPTDAAGKPDAPVGEVGVPDSGDGCDHLYPPPPPPGLDDGTISLEMVVVMKELKLATQTGAVSVGYDLDGKCTKANVPESQTCLGKKDFADPGERGVDNNGGLVFNNFNSIPGQKKINVEDRANEGILEGKNSLLVRVTGYNGKPDDRSVSVSIYASPGLRDVNGNRKAPEFLETEAWSLARSQFNEALSDLPKATVGGYVANGKVVAELDAATIGLSASLSLTLTGGVFTGVVDLSKPKPTMTSGIIAGRWAVTDMLRVIARQRTSDGGQALCDDTSNFDFAKAIICGELDILTDKRSDQKQAAPPLVNCDAVSVSVSFSTGPASLGPRVDEPPDEPCPGFVAGDCK